EPADNPDRVYVIQPGDTLFGIATRFGTTVDALAAANGIADPSSIQAGQSLTIPGGNPPTVSVGPIRGLDIWPSPVPQGQVLVITARADEGAFLDGWLDGQRLAFSREGDVAFALVPVGFGDPPGARQLVVWARTSPEDAVRLSLTAQVREGTFESSLVTIPPDRVYLLDPALIERDRLQLERAFGTRTVRKLWAGEFVQPIQGTLTTSFGAYREYNDGRRESRHGGIDLSAPTGTPVMAANAGRVVFAGPLQVYGNGIVIDHGLGLASAYFHLHTIGVQVGQMVQKGDVIGTVGNTGLSTGAHLHWEMRLGNVPVDPTQWMSHAIP
ncbi:MAG: M23 family metallopeptidase, partial [Anaerolineae bacterium]|nr:M23 family metallopeptidase [Anaerolineae bacterium]